MEEGVARHMRKRNAAGVAKTHDHHARERFALLPFSADDPTLIGGVALAHMSFALPWFTVIVSCVLLLLRLFPDFCFSCF